MNTTFALESNHVLDMLGTPLIRTRVREDNCPEVRIPVVFDPSVGTLTIEGWFNEIIEDVPTLRRALVDLLHNGHTFPEKRTVLYIHGKGDNGKTIFLNFLKSIFAHNIKRGDDSNIMERIPFEHVNLIENPGRLTCSFYKFGNGYMFEGNIPIENIKFDMDKIDKVQVIKFKKTYGMFEKDPLFHEKINTPENRTEFLNWLVQ